KGFLRIAPFIGFVFIAREHWELAKAARFELDGRLRESSKLAGEDAVVFEREKIGPLGIELANHCIITIVFCALVVEGYIYDYAARRLSDNFVEAHLDKLGTVSKWVLVPRLVTGKEFPKGSKGFELLKELVANRNSLIHSKSGPLFAFEQRSDQHAPSGRAEQILEFNGQLHRKAEAAIRTLDELALVMESLDPEEITSFFFQANVGKRKSQIDKYGT
ncbi:MAG: hypothetical protein KGJ14_04250, partial [Nitrospirota bacterium]|nr:hypothetical protein [Nitrospirota bacterium]